MLETIHCPYAPVLMFCIPVVFRFILEYLDDMETQTLPVTCFKSRPTLVMSDITRGFQCLLSHPTNNSQLCRLNQRAIGIAFSLGTGDVELLSSFRERNLLLLFDWEYVWVMRV